MQHCDDVSDDLQARGRNLQPRVEGVDQLAPYILPWVLMHIVIRTHEDLVVLRRPCPVLIFGAVHAGLVAPMRGFHGRVFVCH